MTALGDAHTVVDHERVDAVGFDCYFAHSNEIAKSAAVYLVGWGQTVDLLGHVTPREMKKPPAKLPGGFFHLDP